MREIWIGRGDSNFDPNLGVVMPLCDAIPRDFRPEQTVAPLPFVRRRIPLAGRSADRQQPRILQPLEVRQVAQRLEPEFPQKPLRRHVGVLSDSA